jgi:hypothetical protein
MYEAGREIPTLRRVRYFAVFGKAGRHAGAWTSGPAFLLFSQAQNPNMNLVSRNESMGLWILHVGETEATYPATAQARHIIRLL